MLKFVKENWNVRNIRVVNIGKPTWVIKSTEGCTLQLPEQFCQGKPPRKKFWKRNHLVSLDKIGPYVIGVTINRKRIYLFDEEQYPQPIRLYLQARDEEMQSLWNNIAPVNSDDLQKLPLFMNIRENFLYQKLPDEEIWRKRLALELIICRAIQKICFRHYFPSPAFTEKICEKEFQQVLLEAGFPKKYEKVLDNVVYETKCMLRAYVKDCLLATVSKRKAFKKSEFLIYENAFMPMELSLDSIKSYISQLNT